MEFKTYRKWKKLIYTFNFLCLISSLINIVFWSSAFIYLPILINPYSITFIMALWIFISVFYTLKNYYHKKIKNNIGKLAFLVNEKFELLFNFKTKKVKKNIEVLNMTAKSGGLNYILYNDDYNLALDEQMLKSLQDYLKSSGNPFCNVVFNEDIKNIDEIKSDLIDVIEVDKLTYKFVFKVENLDYYKFLIWLKTNDINKIETNDNILNELINFHKIKNNEKIVVDALRWQRKV
ncbi:hypothetical protein AB5V95_02990 [Metamycoplasma spumans]|uniref:hypothetical protein n=1 Tax=Metamycoplasma spumans TaxID=92406 RepID=UPI0034DD0C3D